MVITPVQSDLINRLSQLSPIAGYVPICQFGSKVILRPSSSLRSISPRAASTPTIKSIAAWELVTPPAARCRSTLINTSSGSPGTSRDTADWGPRAIWRDNRKPTARLPTGRAVPRPGAPVGQRLPRPDRRPARTARDRREVSPANAAEAWGHCGVSPPTQRSGAPPPGEHPASKINAAAKQHDHHQRTTPDRRREVHPARGFEGPPVGRRALGAITIPACPWYQHLHTHRATGSSSGRRTDSCSKEYVVVIAGHRKAAA
jgi:hypothetical protein